jgi:hypothetical protein
MRRYILLGVMLVAAFNAWGYTEWVLNDDAVTVVQEEQGYYLTDEGLFCVTHQASSVSSGDSLEVVIKVPSALSEGAYFWIRVYSTQEIDAALMESFAYSDSGTIINDVNLSEYQGDDATVEVSYGPTDTAAGTAWWVGYVPAGEWFALPECVLDAKSDSIAWCLDLANNGASTAHTSVEIIWHEEQ